jgi:hypothetical protein
VVPRCFAELSLYITLVIGRVSGIYHFSVGFCPPFLPVFTASVLPVRSCSARARAFARGYRSVRGGGACQLGAGGCCDARPNQLKDRFAPNRDRRNVAHVHKRAFYCISVPVSVPVLPNLSRFCLFSRWWWCAARAFARGYRSARGAGCRARGGAQLVLSLVVVVVLAQLVLVVLAAVPVVVRSSCFRSWWWWCVVRARGGAVFIDRAPFPRGTPLKVPVITNIITYNYLFYRHLYYLIRFLDE